MIFCTDISFGFWKNHSTSLALLEVVDSFYKSLDGKNKMLGIYFDLQQYFDTVDYQILLNKLYHVGVRGIMHNWLKKLPLQTKTIYSLLWRIFGIGRYYLWCSTR